MIGLGHRIITNKLILFINTDFEKALDKAPHRELIDKVKAYGLCESIITWITAFLTSRCQKVRINLKNGKKLLKVI